MTENTPNIHHNVAELDAAANRAALQFINAAKEFEHSEIDRVRKNSKAAWRIAGVCLLLTGIAVGAVAGLTPFKTVEPFVIRVDNNTGMTDIVTTMKTSEKSYGEVMDKFWLTQYVKYREGYDWQTLQNTFDATNLLSSPEEQRLFSSQYKDNPNAPHQVLKDQYRVNVKVNAVAFVGDMAQVRFEKHIVPLTQGNETAPPPQKWIATIAYTYRNAPMDDNDRMVNPLGFQVLSYRVDKES